jgi:hypothetical protein
LVRRRGTGLVGSHTSSKGFGVATRRVLIEWLVCGEEPNRLVLIARTRLVDHARASERFARRYSDCVAMSIDRSRAIGLNCGAPRLCRSRQFNLHVHVTHSRSRGRGGGTVASGCFSGASSPPFEPPPASLIETSASSPLTCSSILPSTHAPPSPPCSPPRVRLTFRSVPVFPAVHGLSPP